MNAPVSPSLTLVRRMKASPSKVWHAWTTPSVMAQWFGPHHTRVESAEVDLRIDGAFLVRLVEDSGERHAVTGRYAEIEPERRLVFSWHWVSMPDRVSRVTVVLRPIDEGTEVTLTHDRFADADTAKRHTRGWTESLERLGALIDSAI